MISSRPIVCGQAYEFTFKTFDCVLLLISISTNNKIEKYSL